MPKPKVDYFNEGLKALQVSKEKYMEPVKKYSIPNGPSSKNAIYGFGKTSEEFTCHTYACHTFIKDFKRSDKFIFSCKMPTENLNYKQEYYNWIRALIYSLFYNCRPICLC